ncbi:MAG: hypothetical protein QM811_04485 [Pirellulales bacterium]
MIQQAAHVAERAEPVASAVFAQPLDEPLRPGEIRPIAGHGGLNEPALLPPDDSTPALTVKDDYGPPPTAAELLAGGWFERWRAADHTTRREMVVALDRRGCAPADMQLLRLYAGDDTHRAAAAVERLPERADVDGESWLRAFAEHPAPVLRKSAIGWLLTRPDRATQTWLLNRMLRETDDELRVWFHQTLAVREKATSRSRR